MKHRHYDIQRRKLLKFGSIALVSAAFGARPGKSIGQGARLDEKDAQAQALGYRHEASKVDKTKFAKYKAGETCDNCTLYQGKPKEAWGPCQIFPGKQVNAKGWCSAYVKKA